MTSLIKTEIADSIYEIEHDENQVYEPYAQYIWNGKKWVKCSSVVTNATNFTNI